MTARTVAITGATRGVGRGIADAFARRGDALVIVVLTESVEYHLTDPKFDELKHRMAHMGPYGEAVARVADRPLDFHGRYLENHDLEALGSWSPRRRGLAGLDDARPRA